MTGPATRKAWCLLSQASTTSRGTLDSPGVTNFENRG